MVQNDTSNGELEHKILEKKKNTTPIIVQNIKYLEIKHKAINLSTQKIIKRYREKFKQT